MFRKVEPRKQWRNYFINKNAHHGKNTTLDKTHKQRNPVQLLPTDSITAIEKLARIIENISAPLTESMAYRNRDIFHVLDIVYNRWKLDT